MPGWLELNSRLLSAPHHVHRDEMFGLRPRTFGNAEARALASSSVFAEQAGGIGIHQVHGCQQTVEKRFDLSRSNFRICLTHEYHETYYSIDIQPQTFSTCSGM